MKKRFIAAGAFGVLFLLLILLVKTADVAQIGPAGTVIGLSHINGAVSGFFGINMLWYDITEALGIAALAVAAVFALAGVFQLVRRKSLKRVDVRILALGALYIVVLALYALFEKAPVNYRPVLMPGCDLPEASFPSSHTVLICTVMGSAAMLLKYYIKNPGLCAVLRAVCMLIIAVTVLGRLFSGVHWLTDIIGGVFLSAALLLLYSGVLEKTDAERKGKTV